MRLSCDGIFSGCYYTITAESAGGRCARSIDCSAIGRLLHDRLITDIIFFMHSLWDEIPHVMQRIGL